MNEESIAFAGLLRACSKKTDLSGGTPLHAHALRRGLLDKGSHILDSLVVLYANCDALAKAQELLNGHSVRDVVSWTALIAGYERCGRSRDALLCYCRMQTEGIHADAVTFTCVLKACSTLGDFNKGKEIHDTIVREGLLDDDVLLGTALVDMYAKCGALTKAHQALDDLPFRDIIPWNALITGYCCHGQGKNALDCFEQLQLEGLYPNAVTFSCALKACANIEDIDTGEEIYKMIMKEGLLQDDVSLGNSLIDMYIKCGALVKAQQVLESLAVRDVVSWSALIGGCARQGQGQEALDVFTKMKLEGLSPNAVTLASLLKACCSTGSAIHGEKIHDKLVRQGLLEKNIALGNALVDMYAKCGALAKAKQVLEGLPVRNVISWSTLIAGYTDHGQGEKAISCVERMKQEGISPNSVTFTCLLKACSIIGATEKGEKFHDDISRQGFLNDNLVLGTALLDMYAKCGDLTKAQKVLDELPHGDVACWSALISGYAQQGHTEQALNCFGLMQVKGLAPDTITFACVLNACSHSVLMNEGEEIFNIMTTKFGIKPELEHIVSMVALFGQAGRLDKAVELVQNLPSLPMARKLWLSLMAACNRWGDAKTGRWVFEHVVKNSMHLILT